MYKMETVLANLISEVTPLINSLVIALLGFLATWLGMKMRALMDRVEKSQKIQEIKERLEINQKIVKMSTDYVEQVGQHLLDTEKFKLANKKAHEIMNDWGITISDAEVEALIEQAVGGYHHDEEEEDDEELILMIDFDEDEETAIDGEDMRDKIEDSDGVGGW